MPVYGFQKSREKNHEPKVWTLLPNLCGFQGYGFKNLLKIFRLALIFILCDFHLSCEESAAVFVGEEVTSVPYSVEESPAPEGDNSVEEDEEPGLLERLEEATHSLLSR
jgi:hypothetical protein